MSSKWAGGKEAPFIREIQFKPQWDTTLSLCIQLELWRLKIPSIPPQAHIALVSHLCLIYVKENEILPIPNSLRDSNWSCLGHMFSSEPITVGLWITLSAGKDVSNWSFLTLLVGMQNGIATGKTAGQFLIKIKIRLTVTPNSTQGFTEETLCSQKDLYLNNLSNLNQNSPKLETPPKVYQLGNE